jgi:methylthioribose-1-phosphate isomerase
VDIVIFGADRVAANGDVANKIGTYKVSVVARENGIPVYAVVPTSTIDLNLPDGDHIPIEERDAKEVLYVGETLIAPADTPVYNPAFDVTPQRYLTGIVTEEGICYPPFQQSLRRAKEAAEARVHANRSRRSTDISADIKAASGATADNAATNPGANPPANPALVNPASKFTL